jgi:hypothetical protein
MGWNGNVKLAFALSHTFPNGYWPNILKEVHGLMVEKPKLEKPPTFKGGPLGETLGFSNMVSIMFELSFKIESVISNYKMFFSIQNDIFNCLPK